MPDDPDFEKAKQKAFRLLALRARSEKELRDRLREKKIDVGVIDRVASRLRELKYLDDESFARQWVRHQAVDRLSGDRKIAAGLREKGISRALGERVIAEIRNEFPEREAILRLMRGNRIGAKGQAPDVREKRRLAARLMARGFAPGVIFETIDGSEEEG